MGKKKLLSNSKNKMKIKVGGKEVEESEEIINLGQSTSMDNRQNKEITRRIKQGWKNFWSLKFLYKGKMSIGTKIKALETCTLPALTYGAQTWAITDAQLDKLRKTQLAMERSILGIRRRDKIANARVREGTGSKDVRYWVKKWNLGTQGM